MVAVDLDALVREAKEELTKPATVTQEVLVGSGIVEFEFTKLEPMEWRSLCATFPPRSGVVRDMNLGYNYDAVPGGFPATHIKQVEGDTRIEVPAETWKAVFGVLESPDLFNVSTALWGLHEWGPSQRAVEAKKALTKKRSSSSLKR